MKRLQKRPLFWILVVVVSLTLPAVAAAGAEPDRLIRDLLNAKSYQERMRAAYSLGELPPSPKVQKALLKALDDPHEGVRTAVLKSLAEVGDASVIELLKKRTDVNHIVQAELRRTIVLLEERFPEKRSEVDWSKVKGAIEIGAITNKSGVERKALIGNIREYCYLYLRMQAKLAAADGPGGLKGLDDVLKRHDIKPLVVMVNINSLKKRLTGVEAVWEAAISLTLLDYPDRWIRGTLKNSGSATRPMEQYSPKIDPAMQDEALKRAVELAIEDLAKRLVTL